MAYRYHPKNTEVDSDNPRAWAAADCCGFQWPLHQLRWQYSYRGTTTPQNTRFLVCPKHIDPLNPQDSPVILPPDPLPIYNARPENYTLDEASFLITQDGSIITTESGLDLITPEPRNPDDSPLTVHLACAMKYHLGSVASVFLDLFNGNPTGSAGVSVLAAITGSATRTNIASQLTTTITTQTIATNTSPIVVTASSLSAININYAGLYNAASGGALLTSGVLSVVGPPPSITVGAPVQFDALALSINLT